MSFGSPRRMKAVNEALVREALIARGTATMAELSGDTGLSQTTVGQTLSLLESAGQIRRVGTLASSGGRPAASWAFSSGCVSGLALAIHERELVWGRTDALGAVLERGTVTYAGDAVEAAARFAGSFDWGGAGRRVCSLGVPGAVRAGRVLTGFLAGEWGGRSLGDWLEVRLGVPVTVENDLNAIALGYLRSTDAGDAFGDSRGDGRPDGLAYLHFNKRCSGAGIVIDGKIVRGATDFAGEIGFLPMPDGRTFDEARLSCADDGAYADLIAALLVTVNCLVNPPLVVVGGFDFRHDLGEAIRGRFAVRAAAGLDERLGVAVRPGLRFVEDSSGHYLAGLGYLAAARALPATRLTAPADERGTKE